MMIFPSHIRLDRWTKDFLLWCVDVVDDHAVLEQSV